MSVSIIDLIAVAFVIFFAAMGIKKGLFEIVFNLAANIFVLIASKILAVPISTYLYDMLFHNKVLEKLGEIIPKGGDVIETLENTLSPAVVRIAEALKIFPDAQAAAEWDAALNIEQIEANYVMPIILKILAVVVTVVLFFILIIVVKLLISAFDKVLFKRKSRRKSVGAKLNQALGMIFGIIKGLIPTVIICAALNLIAPMLNITGLTDAVNKSFICNFIAGIIK